MSRLRAEATKSQQNHIEGEVGMSKVRVAGFGVSLEGFSAGVEQSLSDPPGKRGTEIFQWFFHTRSFRSMHGQEGGSVGDIDDRFAQQAMDNFGAFILVATGSVPCADHGCTTLGRAGGAKTRLPCANFRFDTLRT